jgi:CDP-glucose 4,6-dehydratase
MSAMNAAVIDPAFWRGRRVMLTGHTGFKGAWLGLLLHRLGAEVLGFSLPPPTTPSLFDLAGVGADLRTVTGDVRDAAALAAAVRDFAPEVLLHMAAQSVVLDSYADPLGTYSTNVMGTANLLEAVRRAGLTRPLALVNVTTDKVYHNQRWLWSYRENEALGGRDPYSNSKACSELVTQSFVASFFPPERRAEHGVAVASARAGNVIGGGDWTPHQLVPAIIAAAQAGQPVALRNPAGVRPWQHVLDCLHGYLGLAERLLREPHRAAGDWNFGPPSDEVVTVAQVAEGVARHWALSPAWTQAPGERPPEEPELRLDCSKAARQLGWRCRLATPQALDWVAQWHLRHQAGEGARRICLDQIDAFLAHLGLDVGVHVGAEAPR